MRVLIVEDETTAYENLKDMLFQIDPQIEIAGNTESIVQTVSWLQKNPAPNLILLDVHLSDGSAFCIFDILPVEIPIIFTTAYDEYAIEAFKVNSIDYILKPVKEDDIVRALNKFNKLSSADRSAQMERIQHTILQSKYRGKLLVPCNDQLIPISVHNISCFYTADKRTNVLTNDGRSFSYPRSLEQIYTTLNPRDFFRANKQFIVSRNSVKNITVWFDSRLWLNLNIEVPERIYISKNRASEFKTWIVND